MPTESLSAKRRGRPPRSRDELADTRELLLRAGLEVLTEKGFAAVGINEILARVAVPKGSFYHYFDSKEAYGLQLIDRYAAYFARKLDGHFLDDRRRPLDRLQAFFDDARDGMARHDFRRGCLIGNLGQEMGSLSDAFRARLSAVFQDWEARLADCLRAAQAAGQLSKEADCAGLAMVFWIGWEGAVLRAKLERHDLPLTLFADHFLSSLPRA